MISRLPVLLLRRGCLSSSHVRGVGRILGDPASAVLAQVSGKQRSTIVARILWLANASSDSNLARTSGVYESIYGLGERAKQRTASWLDRGIRNPFRGSFSRHKGARRVYFDASGL